MQTALISTKPYKQWCGARGIDPYLDIQQFPLARLRMYIPPLKAIRLSFWKSIWEKVKAFFRY